MTPRGVILMALHASLVACGSKGDEAPGIARQDDSPSYHPCSLITRPEAEAVLGPLATDPFRSMRDSSAALEDGPTCTYATAGGKALLVTPEWTYGKMMLDVDRMVGGLIRQVADLPGPSADTLEGPWDDAAVGVAGDLVLLKGARSITIAYLNSSTDAAGAIRLAGPAIQRLSAVPEPAHPTVSGDGCPLTAEVVTRIIGLPVRLAPRPVRLIDACTYTLANDPTVEVELAIKPGEMAELITDGLQQRMKAMLGDLATADALTMGEGGLAYGSGSGAEAAVRAAGSIYHARMAYPLSTTTPDLKREMVLLVGAMMDRRTREGGTGPGG